MKTTVTYLFTAPVLRCFSLWANDMKTVIEADELPQDVPGAEELLQRHSEHKGEIDTRRNSFKSFQREGQKLISANHYAKEDVRFTQNTNDIMLHNYYVNDI